MKKGWEHKTIGDIAVVDWGNTSLTKKAYVENGKFLGVSAAGCDGRMEHAEHQKFTPVLSAIGARCGTMFLPAEDFTAIKNTITLTPKGEFCDAFFLYYLMTYVDLPQRGAGQPFISKGDIQKFEIRLPPLEEQKRIVAVLDEAFDGLVRARSNAEANLQNAEDLFESFRDYRLSNPLDGWISVKFGECIRLRSGDGLTKKQMKPGEYKVFGGNGVAGLHSEFNLSGDNLIIGRVGALCGNARNVVGDIWLTDNAFRIADTTYEFHNPFLEHLLNFKNLRGLARQAAQPVISNSSLKELKLQFPESVDAQEDIASKINSMVAESERLAGAYELLLFNIDQLKQSLLQKAFAGELT